MIIKLVKAQSIVEYLLVFAGIVLAVLYGANKLSQGSKTQMGTAAGVVNKTNQTVADKLLK